MLQTKDLIGKPFQDGGRGPESYDCWGLVLEVFRRYGIELPDYQISCNADLNIDKQINAERCNWVRCHGEIPVPALVVIQESGLCDHTGVYTGNGRFIHARQKVGVVKEAVEQPVWKRRIEGFYVPGR
ncbi:MAG: NlpC/P60 family protein [Veillonellales bacterium]